MPIQAYYYEVKRIVHLQQIDNPLSIILPFLVNVQTAL